jgi:hypothetical protein
MIYPPRLVFSVSLFEMESDYAGIPLAVKFIFLLFGIGLPSAKWDRLIGFGQRIECLFPPFGIEIREADPMRSPDREIFSLPPFVPKSPLPCWKQENRAWYNNLVLKDGSAYFRLSLRDIPGGAACCFSEGVIIR